MSNIRLATWLAFGGTAIAIVGIFIIARWSDDSLALIDKAPIKAVLIALTLSIIALIA